MMYDVNFYSCVRFLFQNVLLIQDARAAKTYRDELDILKERVSSLNVLSCYNIKYVSDWK